MQGCENRGIAANFYRNYAEKNRFVMRILAGVTAQNSVLLSLQAPIIAEPETVIESHRQSFTLYRRWKSRTNKVGRPMVPKAVRKPVNSTSKSGNF